MYFQILQLVGDSVSNLNVNNLHKYLNIFMKVNTPHQKIAVNDAIFYLLTGEKT